MLRPEAGGNRTIEVSASTVRGALDELVASYPSLAPRILAEDGIPTFLNVFVDGDDIRLLEGLDTPIADGATVLLLPAVAGGAQRR